MPSKPPPSRLTSHLDTQFSHNTPPPTVMRPRVASQKTGRPMSNGEMAARFIQTHRQWGFYHGPPRDPSKSFQVLGPLGWQVLTWLQLCSPLSPAEALSFAKGPKKKRPCSKLQFSFGESCCPSLAKAKLTFFCSRKEFMIE